MPLVRPATGCWYTAAAIGIAECLSRLRHHRAGDSALNCKDVSNDRLSAGNWTGITGAAARARAGGLYSLDQGALAGSAFGGMGASREMTVAAIAEPTIALAIFGLAVGAGSTNLGRIVAQTLANPGAVINPGHLLGFASLFIVMLAETGRMPVDNPS